MAGCSGMTGRGGGWVVGRGEDMGDMVGIIEDGGFILYVWGWVSYWGCN